MACKLKDTMRLLVEELRNVETKLAKGVVYTTNGENLNYTKDMLTNMIKDMKHGKKDFSKYLNEKKVLVGSLRKSLYRKHLKESFKVRFSKSTEFTKKPIEVKLLDVIDEKGNVTLVVDNNGSPLQFTFTNASSVSLPSKQGIRMKVPGLGSTIDSVRRIEHSMTSGLLNKHTRDEMVAQLQKVMAILRDPKPLGSTEGIKFNYTTSNLYSDYVHGDVNHMKELVSHLHILGGGKESEEHLNHLFGLLDQMHPSFFKDMTVFINENQNTTAGWVDIDNKHMLFNVSNTASYQTEAEVAVHEIVHTMTAWALKQDNEHVSRLKRQLNHAMKTAMKNTTWEDLLDVPIEDASKEDIDHAKKQYAYIFTSEHSDEEFIAHALTNPVFMEHLKQISLRGRESKASTLFQKIAEFFMDLMDIVLGNYDFNTRNKDVYSQVHALAFKLAELNNKTEQDIRNRNWFGKLNELVNTADSNLYELMEKALEKVADPEEPIEPMPANPTKLQQALYLGKVIRKSVYSRPYRNLLGVYLSMIKVSANGSIREFFRDFFASDQMTQLVEFLGLENNKIDTIRNSYVSTAKEQLLEGFTRPLSEKEDSALTRVLLETNATNILIGKTTQNTYDEDAIVNLLRNQNTLKRTIETVKNELSTLAGERSNWVIAQTEGLGQLMATHEGNLIQNTNAYAIAIGVNSGEDVQRHSQRLEDKIDELASLYALLYTSKQQKQLVADLMVEDYSAINNIVEMYESFKATSEQALFEYDKIHKIAGYTKELFDNTILIEVAPTDAHTVSMMEKEGYKLKHVLKPKGGEVRETEFGLYVSDSYSQPERLRGAVSLGRLHARGTSLKELKYKEDATTAPSAFRRDRAVMKKNVAELTQQIKNGDITINDVPKGIMPVFDAEGKIVDFRYMMDKTTKESLLKQNSSISEVLPRSLGGTIDKELRDRHNSKVVQTIAKDMATNWRSGNIGVNLEEYSVIGPDVSDAKMRELYYMLPKKVQHYVISREDRVIAVPTKLLNTYFGYTHITLGNMTLFKKLPASIRRIMNMLESYWIDMIKVAKANVLLKMPAILLGNVLSNILYGINEGMSPTEILRAYSESFRDVKAFMQNHKEQIKLELEVASMTARMNIGTISKADIKKLEKKKNELAYVTKKLKDSPVKELFDLGLYQSVVEDIETSAMNDPNRATAGVKKLLNKAPIAIRKGVQTMYLTQETKWYQAMQEFLQISDLIARDVKNRKMKKAEKEMVKGERDIPKELRDLMGKDFPKRKRMTGNEQERFLNHAATVRHSELLYSFVNYIKPNGRFEEWLNRLGLVMFTKYFKRIQRVIAKSDLKHPLRSVTTILAASVAMDLDNIQDATLLTKGIRNGEFEFTNMIPVYSPLENILNVATPAIFKPELYLQ